MVGWEAVYWRCLNMTQLFFYRGLGINLYEKQEENQNDDTKFDVMTRI